MVYDPYIYVATDPNKTDRTMKIFRLVLFVAVVSTGVGLWQWWNSVDFNSTLKKHFYILVGI